MHEGHRERLKNRFLKEGLDHFEPHQVLELILFFSIPRKDTNETAHALLDKFGSLSGIMEADVGDIASVPGVGNNSAVLLSLIPQISRIYFKDKWGNKPVLNSSSKAGEYALSLFTGRLMEVFFVICLDTQNRVNFPALVHEGTINEAPVYPRIIVEAALRHQAASVILAHNHPGGSLKPSNADMAVTKKIISALDAIDIHVVDHIIVAGDQYTSFAEKGILNTQE